MLSNNGSTVTRSNEARQHGFLGSHLMTEGTHSFTCLMDKCETEYVWVGVAYDNVDLYANSLVKWTQNISLRGCGKLYVFSTGTAQGQFAGYRTGDSIRMEVDMAAKLVTFYKNDVRLCQASGINAPVRPFISIGDRNVVVTISFPGARGTPLHLAALCNTGGGVVSRLLAVGCQELLDMKSSDGRTVRELAAAKRHTDVVAEIDRWVSQQEAWNQEGAHNASLIAAAHDNDVPTIQMLLAKGANLYAQDVQGFSALHAAAQAGHKDVADLLLKKGGMRLAALTTKEGKTARDLTVCQLRDALIAKPALLDSQQTRVDQASDTSKERARGMMAFLDSQMAKLDTEVLRSQTDLTASDVHESKYLLTYEQEQAQLRENLAVVLDKCRLTRDKHAKLDKELCDKYVQLWHEHMEQMRATQEQHRAELRVVEEQLQADNVQLKQVISCIYDRHAEEQARFRAIQERVESIQAAYVKSCFRFSLFLLSYIIHLLSYLIL